MKIQDCIITGARYYNPRLSIWYGVDPLAEKYPSWSPYVYTFNNPINYIDPDGREPMIGPGPRGTFGSLNWKSKIRYSDNYILPVGSVGYFHTMGRTGNLTSFDGQRKLDIMQTYGHYADLITARKYDSYLPFNKNNNNYSQSDNTTNCFGYVLTNGYFFVNNSPSEVGSFLTHSGYSQVKGLNSKTNFKVGDILLWSVSGIDSTEAGGHIMEATGKNKSGEVIWESFFGGDSVPVNGTLKEVMNYNSNIGEDGANSIYGTFSGAALLRPNDQSKIKFGEKKI